MKILTPKPLTREAFAPFGDVIETEGAHHYPINEGTTERYHDLANLNMREGGRAIVSIFRGQPRSYPMEIRALERHPLGSQAFIPMQRRPYLVVVAESQLTSREPGSVHAFIARGDQGVNYAAGTWHHPLLAMDEVSDFVVIDRKGEGHNCDVFELAETLRLQRN